MRRLLLFIGALLLLASSGASAATLTCGPGGAFSTCVAAVAAANPGDTVQLVPNYYGPGGQGETFNINTPGLTIDGNGNWWDYSQTEGENLAGWSGGNPYSGFGGMVPGYQRSYTAVPTNGTFCGITVSDVSFAPPGTPTTWTPNTCYSSAKPFNNGSSGSPPINSQNTSLTSVINNNRLYVVVTPGTSGSGPGPVGTTPLGTETDGSVTWVYVPDYRSVVFKNFVLTGAAINYDNFQLVGPIAVNGEGLVTVKNSVFVGNQVGVSFRNWPGSVFTIQDSVFFNNGINYCPPPGSGQGCHGGAYVSGSNSHNMYVDNIAELNLTRVITTRATDARPIKFRGNHLVANNVITDSGYGGDLNLPNGGLFTWTGSGGSIWNMPPSTPEKQVMTYADEMYFTPTPAQPTPYSVSGSNLISNTAISIQSGAFTTGVATFIFVEPYFGTTTFDGTDTWYNSIIPVVPTDGPSPRVVGVPTSTTGSVMTIAQWDAALAIDTASESAQIAAFGYFAGHLAYYDISMPPWQAAPALVGNWPGPSPGDTITVVTHPNITAVHGVPYVAVATGNYPGTPAPLAKFTSSNTTGQNVYYIGSHSVGGVVDIFWGDGTGLMPDNFLTATGGPGAGCVPITGCTTGPTLTLYAAHTYATAGSYTVTITFHEVSPGTGTVTTTLTATVS